MSLTQSVDFSPNLFAIFDKVVDVDDAHWIDAPQLIDLAIMCLENCRKRTDRRGVINLA